METRPSAAREGRPRPLPRTSGGRCLSRPGAAAPRGCRPAPPAPSRPGTFRPLPDRRAGRGAAGLVSRRSAAGPRGAARCPPPAGGGLRGAVLLPRRRCGDPPADAAALWALSPLRSDSLPLPPPSPSASPRRFVSPPHLAAPSAPSARRAGAASARWLLPQPGGSQYEQLRLC